MRSGKPCQDEVGAFAVGDFVAVAVADGHGTSRLADVGARLAVEVTLAALARFADGLANANLSLREVQGYAEHPLRVQLVREWVDRVRARPDAATAPLVDYGSTLIFSLSTPRFVMLGQLGDGDVLLVQPAGPAESPLPADPRAFADETPSLCQPEAWHGLRVRVLPPPPAGSLLILSTDGYSKSYANDDVFRQIGPDYLGLIEADGFHALLPHIPGFLQEITTRGSGDDIGVALLYWPKPVAAEASATAAASQPPGGEAPPLIENATATSGETEDAVPDHPSGEPASMQPEAVPPPDERVPVAADPAPEGAADGEDAVAEDGKGGPVPPDTELMGAPSPAPPGNEDVERIAHVVAVPEAAAPPSAEPTESASEQGAPTSSQPSGDDDARVSEDG